MLRKAMAAVLAAGTGLAGQAGAEGMTRRGYEMPPYRVEATEGAREIRSYGARIVAEVTVRGDRRAAVNTGFRLLAGYIFGANAGGEKIAMTVPVDQADRGEGLWTVRFTMPAAFTAETLPAPQDPRIRLVPVGPARMAVEGFSGIPEDDDMAARAAALAAWAGAQGLRVEGGPVYSFYDAPWTPGAMRRNEVAFHLR